jgi:hypothetical protein
VNRAFDSVRGVRQAFRAQTNNKKTERSVEIAYSTKTAMKKTRFVAIVLLLAAIMSSFPREAAAANRPKWLKITWTWSLEKRGTKDA